MITVLISHKVRDFNLWLNGFEDNSTARELSGCKGCRVFTDPDNSTQVTIEAQWKSLSTFNKYFESSRLRQVMDEAGVIGQPDVKILSEVQYAEI